MTKHIHRKAISFTYFAIFWLSASGWIPISHFHFLHQPVENLPAALRLQQREQDVIYDEWTLPVQMRAAFYRCVGFAHKKPDLVHLFTHLCSLNCSLAVRLSWKKYNFDQRHFQSVLSPSPPFAYISQHHHDKRSIL